MSRILDEIGIYGYSLNDENRVLAGLVTGDPQLFIGRHGSAKTMLAEEIARALFHDHTKKVEGPDGVITDEPYMPFVAYDASKAAFEDVIGFPNPKDLQQGKMSFVHGPVTIWDKLFVFIDEINRAEADMQSKWLEVVRSKRIMGYETPIIFCWAAMNPKGYEGANDLDEALVGRFANFIYVPDVLDLSDGLRAQVAARVGRDDSPAIKKWLGGNGRSIQVETPLDYGKMGTQLHKIIIKSAKQYMNFIEEGRERVARGEQDRIATWVSYFANTLRAQSSVQSSEETKTEPILLDGRRLGMIRRQILAVRAIQMVRANLLHEPLPDMRKAAEIAVKGAIPTGVNVDGGVDENAIGIIDKSFRALENYWADQKDERMFKIITELTSSRDLVRRAKILLTEPLDELMKNSEWTRLCSEEHSLDLSVLSFLASMIEAKHPGSVPSNVLSQLSQHIDEDVLNPAVAPLREQHMGYADRLTELIEQFKGEEKIPQRLMAIAKVNGFIQETSEDSTDAIADTVVKRLEKEVKSSCDQLEDLIETGVAA